MRYKKTVHFPLIISIFFLVLITVFSVFFILRLNGNIDQLNKKIDIITVSNESMQEQISKKDEEISKLKKDLENAVNAQQTSSGSSIKGPDKTVYLTFDDGPTKNTPKVLDILKQYDIKATFFVIGVASSKEFTKSTLQRIKNEGHAIGLHSYTHDYKTIYKNTDAYFEDFNKMNNYIEECTGSKTNIFRFPGGSNNTVSKKYSGHVIMHELVQKTKQLGYQHIDWNVSSGDAESNRVPAAQLVKNTLKGVHSHKTSVVLMHDAAAKTTTVEALPQIIKTLKSEGYKFEVLSTTSFAPQFYKN